jgi:hypothetical protein
MFVLLLHDFGKCSTSGIGSSPAAELHQLLQQLLDFRLMKLLVASYPPVPWQAAAEIGCLGAEDLDMGYIVTSLLQALNLKYCHPDLVASGFLNRIAEKDHLDAAALEDW